jgi:acetyl-CoA C-acetyltransferase
MRDVVIASYVRSAQSRCRPNDPGRDWLFKIRTDDLLAKLLPEAISRAGLEAKDIDDFIMGCAQAVGENFTLGGRGPHLLANLDKRTSCKQIDEQCGSTMAALQMGFMEIAQGFADVVMCGGMEHMGRIPMGGDGKIELNLRLFSEPSLLHWDFMNAMNRHSRKVFLTTKYCPWMSSRQMARSSRSIRIKPYGPMRPKRIWPN